MNSGPRLLRLRFQPVAIPGPARGPFRRFYLRFAPWLTFFIMITAASQSLAIQVIANPSTPVATLSQLKLRAIYTSRLKRWEDGTEIQVFVLPQTDSTHQTFCKSVLNALPHQLQAVWNRMVYSGMGRPPIEVQSEQEMMARVSQTPGAIGYIQTANDASNVQVIKVEILH